MSIFIDNLRSKTENQIEVDKKRKERESIIASEIKKDQVMMYTIL